MKSIKEKAEELSIAFRKEQGDVGYSEQLSYKLGIEAGANYVLSAITECLPKTHSFNPNEAIDIITSMIKELKK